MGDHRTWGTPHMGDTAHGGHPHGPPKSDFPMTPVLPSRHAARRRRHPAHDGGVLARYRALVARMDTDDLLAVAMMPGLVAWFCADMVANHGSPPWARAGLVVSLIPTVAFGAPWAVRAWRAPDRSTVPWNRWDSRFWWITVLLAVSADAGGILGLTTGGADQRGSSTATLLVGVALTAFLVRHLRKPIRPPRPLRRDHDPWDDEPPRPGWPKPG
jgi:hypothetical protein